MSEFKNLDKLADQLYRDGMEKAQKESERILNDAQNEAERKIANATNEAERIIEKALREAEKQGNAVQNELQQKARQVIQDLKIEIEKLITAQVLDLPLKEVFSDREFVEKLIISAMDSWKKGEEVELLIPQYFKGMESDLKAKVHKNLPGLKVMSDVNQGSGFQIENKEKGYILSFTETDFMEFFKPYLSDSVQTILFNQG